MNSFGMPLKTTNRQCHWTRPSSTLDCKKESLNSKAKTLAKNFLNKKSLPSSDFSLIFISEDIACEINAYNYMLDNFPRKWQLLRLTSHHPIIKFIRRVQQDSWLTLLKKRLMIKFDYIIKTTGPINKWHVAHVATK